MKSEQVVAVEQDKDGQITTINGKDVLQFLQERIAERFREEEHEREVSIHRAFGMPEVMIEQICGPRVNVTVD